MNTQLDKVFNAMQSDASIGVAIKAVPGDLIRRQNTKERPKRPTFFLADDIKYTGKEFKDFIKELLEKHGKLEITPRKQIGTGVRAIPNLNGFLVEKAPKTNQSQSAVTNEKPAVMSENNLGINSQMAQGMNAFQVADLISRANRAEDYQSQLSEAREERNDYKNQVKQLIEDNRALQVKVDTSTAMHDLEKKMIEVAQNKGFKTDDIPKITNALAPLLGAMISKGPAAPISAGMNAGAGYSESKKSLIDVVLKTELSDDTADVLKMQIPMMADEKFVTQLDKLLTKNF